MNKIFELLNPDNTITVNRPLAHAIGTLEALTYAALLSKYYYYSQHEMLDDGWFYSTAADLEESIALTERQQRRCIKNLEAAGLIRCELRGMPAKRSFAVAEDVELIERYIADGERAIGEVKPTAARKYKGKRRSDSDSCQMPEGEIPATEIPVNKLPAGETPAEDALGAVHTQLSPHYEAVSRCSDKTEKQAPASRLPLNCQNEKASSDLSGEQHLNKSKYNKSKANQSIYRTQACEDGMDEIDFSDNNFCDNSEEREDYCRLIKDNIDYEYLLELNKTEKERIDELINLATDVVCSRCPTIRVNGGDIPQEVVKAVFLKLNSEHISYVLTSLRKNTTKIRNIRSYLITALYNAPKTIDNYYAAEVNHDMCGVPPQAIRDGEFRAEC